MCYITTMSHYRGYLRNWIRTLWNETKSTWIVWKCIMFIWITCQFFCLNVSFSLFCFRFEATFFSFSTHLDFVWSTWNLSLTFLLLQILEKLYDENHIAIGNELLKLSSILISVGDHNAVDCIKRLSKIFRCYYGSHVNTMFPFLNSLEEETHKFVSTHLWSQFSISRTPVLSC